MIIINVLTPSSPGGGCLCFQKVSLPLLRLAPHPSVCPGAGDHQVSVMDFPRSQLDTPPPPSAHLEFRVSFLHPHPISSSPLLMLPRWHQLPRWHPLPRWCLHSVLFSWKTKTRHLVQKTESSIHTSIFLLEISAPLGALSCTPSLA